MTSKYSIYQDILLQTAESQQDATLTLPDKRTQEKVYQALNRFRRRKIDQDRAKLDEEINRTMDPMVGEPDAPHFLESIKISRRGENQIRLTYEDPYGFTTEFAGREMYYGWFVEASRLTNLLDSSIIPKLGCSSAEEYFHAWINFREASGGRYFDRAYREEKKKIQDMLLGGVPALPQPQEDPIPQPDTWGTIFGDNT